MLGYPPSGECDETEDLAPLTCPPTVGTKSGDPIGTPRSRTPCSSTGSCVSPLHTTAAGFTNLANLVSSSMPLLVQLHHDSTHLRLTIVDVHVCMTGELLIDYRDYSPHSLRSARVGHIMNLSHP